MGVPMTRIDLHAHSTYSDGTFEPAEVIRLGAERDLDVVALTDHDTTDGLPEALATGLELRRLREDRYRRGELMVDELRALGLPIAFERVREIAGDATIVRPHIAQAMVEAGIVETEKEAFERYIGDGRPAHVAKHALDPVDAVALIEAAGGVCALAH